MAFSSSKFSAVRLVAVPKPITVTGFLDCWMPIFYPQYQPGEKGYRARACQLLSAATGLHPSTFNRYFPSRLENLPKNVYHSLAMMDFIYRHTDHIERMGEGMKQRFEFVYPEELSRLLQ